MQPGPLHGAAIDTGLAGTVMRFLPPVAALADGAVTFDGDPYARERPMATLLDGLRQAGVDVEDGGRGRMPFTVHGTGSVDGGAVHIDASASSQFVSGLLLAGARYAKGIEVVHTGEYAVPSQPHIDMTVDVLRSAGVTVSVPGFGVWRVEPGPIHARDWVVEPDLSNAAPFLAAALVTGGSITVPRWPATHHPARRRAARRCSRRWARTSPLRNGELTVAAGERTARARRRSARRRRADADAGRARRARRRRRRTSTASPTCAGTRPTGWPRSRPQIKGLGGDVVEEADALTIHPRPLHAGVWHSYADHRMATAGAVHRPRRRRDRRRRHRRDQQDAARLRRYVVVRGRRLTCRPRATSVASTRTTSGSVRAGAAPDRAPSSGPAHVDAADGMVVTVDRGRYTVLVDGVEVTAMRARELGRKGIAVGDQVSVVGRHVRRS